MTALMVGDRVEVVEFYRLPNGDKTDKSLDGWLVCIDDQSVTIADSPDWASRDDAWTATFSLAHAIVSPVGGFA